MEKAIDINCIVLFNLMVRARAIYMKRLMLITLLGLYVLPRAAFGKQPHHHQMPATEMTTLGFSISAAIGLAGYLTLSRRKTA
jgi:hypothetical protein